MNSQLGSGLLGSLCSQQDMCCTALRLYDDKAYDSGLKSLLLATETTAFGGTSDRVQKDLSDCKSSARQFAQSCFAANEAMLENH